MTVRTRAIDEDERSGRLAVKPIYRLLELSFHHAVIGNAVADRDARKQKPEMAILRMLRVEGTLIVAIH